ncbi:MAG: TolC family protein [Erythrobacter sp.]|uniref:Agglutination protein n=2 Tax=Erythrobacter TaxID=1041 RepID=A0A1A7BEL5_9SPHN|nr:TolC family protein [Erythrobacter sp.]OBV10196.1 Agglutination protein [Erythrobacter dokdonensis DSW-74]
MVIAFALATCSSMVMAQNEAGPVSMREAIETAIASNPEIAQAQMNTEAIQFEREQAQSLYFPTIDVEASAGVRRLENATRRALGIANNWLNPLEAQVRGDWTLFDFGRRRGELLRQAARVDGASLRVLERSEFIALQVARQYLNILLQERIVAAATDNVLFHEQMTASLSEGVSQGSISIADLQQAEERLQAAIVLKSEAEEDLTNAKTSLQRLTGLDITRANLPPALAQNLPASEEMAIGQARTANPLVREAQADVDAANALVMSAKGELAPRIGVDVTGRIGEDIDGFRGETNDVQGRVYIRWQLFDGGRRAAQVQEMTRRASEARFRLHDRVREAEEDVRNAWTAMTTQKSVFSALERQSQVSDDLLLSYRSQFNIGRRSLLDVLDAQNTRFNTQVRRETARFSELFAQYQVLAATNNFLNALNVAPGTGSGTAERERFDYGPSVPAELQRRRYPE